VVAGGALAATAALTGAHQPDAALAERQEEVAERGREVMPFDLDRTSHRFVKSDQGGFQTVTSDDGDDEQVRLIREHLLSEAERFAAGDFSAPGQIHGEDMPGLAPLQDGAADLDIAYRELGDGARLDYTAPADLVEAVHAWFDAQVTDHGEHAADS
jgi:hypothetical protein